MNKEFAVKLLQAKRMEYQAFQELLPKPVIRRIKRLETELISAVRECIFDEADHSAQAEASKTSDTGRKSKKITIE